MSNPGDRTISASVGIGGFNRYEDVVTVQELLNDVPLGEGGPQPKLDVDGISGPLTNKAIQTFQLRHFGWKGADGRVDPDNQTIAKLNSYAPKPTSASLAIQMVVFSNVELDPNRNEQWFFQVRDASQKDRPPARYYLGKKEDLYGTYVPIHFVGSVEQFNAPLGMNADTLEGRAIYSTLRQNWYGGGTSPSITRSRLYLGVGSHFIPIDMHNDIKLGPPKTDPILGGESYNAQRERQGLFIRV